MLWQNANTLSAISPKVFELSFSNFVCILKICMRILFSILSNFKTILMILWPTYDVHIAIFAAGQISKMKSWPHTIYTPISFLILHQMWHIIHQNNRIEKTFNVVNSICGFAHAYSPNDTFSNRCRFLSYTTNLIINLIFFYQNAIIQLHFDVYIMLISLFKVTFRMENKSDILNLDKSYDKLTRNKSDCLKWVFDSVT